MRTLGNHAPHPSRVCDAHTLFFAVVCVLLCLCRLKLSDMQKTQISTLRMQIEESQARLMHFRPMSRERLQPMDEFAKRSNNSNKLMQQAR